MNSLVCDISVHQSIIQGAAPNITQMKILTCPLQGDICFVHDSKDERRLPIHKSTVWM